MTITIKARTAAFALALFCVLAGLAIGQITQADSAAGGSVQVRGIESKLSQISRQLGATYQSGTVLGELSDAASDLSDIKGSTSGTCYNVKSGLDSFYSC